MDGSGISDFVKARLHCAPPTVTKTTSLQCHRFEVISGREKSTDGICPPCIWMYYVTVTVNDERV